MVIAAPLWVERMAVRPARARVVRTGMGARRSRRSAGRLTGSAVLVAGVAAGRAPGVGVGDLVVASRVEAPDGTVVPCHGAEGLAAELHALGLIVHIGPIGCTLRLFGREHAPGVLVVEMESAWLAPADGSPFAVVRAVSDTAARPLMRPGILRDGVVALRALRRAVPALDSWCSAHGTSRPSANGRRA